ncbi:MAG TPA: tautomerase family protein [Gammaproteobacteria bacterium]|nr:tautomerase family protein [Gammaproteobacteria bacterium]
MPMILIEVVNKHTKEQEIALMQAVHSALIASFNVTEEAINTRLLAHEPHRFSVPVNYNPDHYVIVGIDCFSGRSLATKRNLYQTIVENLHASGIPKDHVKIVIREAIRENWGILGGFAACDVQVGYKIEV